MVVGRRLGWGRASRCERKEKTLQTWDIASVDGIDSLDLDHFRSLDKKVDLLKELLQLDEN